MGQFQLQLYNEYRKFQIVIQLRLKWSFLKFNFSRFLSEDVKFQFN